MPSLTIKETKSLAVIRMAITDTQIKQKSCKEIKILTIFLTKDKTTFVKENFESVKNQERVRQDIYTVSAKHIFDGKNNLVVDVPKDLPTPLRIAISIRTILKKINITSYTHIFKVDGDIKLPLDYLINILKKRVCIAGTGPALLISVPFFLEMLKEYPLNYCDDGYILSFGASVLGALPPSYDGAGIIEILPNPVSKKIEYFYGVEYYKFGLPLKILLLNRLLFALSNPLEGLKSITYCLAGYVSTVIKKEKRYKWWKHYSKVATSVSSWKSYISSGRRTRSLKRWRRKLK